MTRDDGLAVVDGWQGLAGISELWADKFFIKMFTLYHTSWFIFNKHQPLTASKSVTSMKSLIWCIKDVLHQCHLTFTFKT